MAHIVRFDDHHPNFRCLESGNESRPHYSAEVYRGGRYVGTVQFAGRACAWKNDYSPAGDFDTADDAILDLITKSGL